MPQKPGIGDPKHVGCYQLLSNSFLYFEIIVFKNTSELFTFLILLFFVIFCLIVRES